MSLRAIYRTVAVSLTLALITTAAWAELVQLPNQEVDIIEHLGDHLPLDLRFVDQNGEERALQEYFKEGRPVIVSLVYYECPMLCSLISGGLVRAMRALDFQIGKDYEAITVSFDPADTTEGATLKRREYLKPLELEEATSAWPFLKGDAEEIQKLTDTLGFRYAPVPGSRELAHAAVVFILAPDGKLTRYLYGVDFPVRDLRLALVEASNGRVGTTLDRVLLRCYRYDPSSRRYALFISTYLRAGGVLILLAAGALIYRMWRKELREAPKGGAAGEMDISS